PSAASVSAIARPILRPAPVTIATLPVSSLVMTSLSAQRRKVDAAPVERRQQLQGSVALRLCPAAVRGIEGKFVDHVLPCQRLLGAAAQMRLPFLDDAAVVQGDADVAGIATWIGILGIDHELDFRGQRQHTRIADRAVAEGAKPDATMDKTGREQIGRGE